MKHRQKSGKKINEQELRIIEEVPQHREECVKHFQRENGSCVASIYAEPVHYLDSDGVWQDIDNTLQQIADDAGHSVFVPAASGLDVSFPQSFSDGQKMTLSHDGFKIRLGIQSDKKTMRRNKREEMPKGHIRAKSAESRRRKAVKTKRERIERANTEKMELRDLSSAVVYEDMFPGADLEYVVTSNKVKENIIVKEAQEEYSYQFQLDLGGLVPVAQEDKSIFLCKQTEDKAPLFIIQAPYMFDAAGVDSTEIDMRFDNGTFQLSADASWVNAPERVFPVTIDPTFVKVVANTSATGLNGPIKDAYAVFGTSDLNQLRLFAGKGELGLKHQTFIKFELPTLPSGSVISGANLYLYQSATHGNPAGKNLQLIVSECTEEWPSWPLFNWSNRPGTRTHLDAKPIVNGFQEDPYDFNLTNAVRNWYEGSSNHGIRITTSNEDEVGRCSFYSTQALPGLILNEAQYRPAIVIRYNTNVGTQSYWPYEAVDLGRSGVASVNVYSGGLTYVHNDLTMKGKRLPIDIAHVYSTSHDKSNGTYKDMRLGAGFRLNIIEHVSMVEDAVLTDACYQLIDGTGTIHHYGFYDEDHPDRVVHEYNPSLKLEASDYNGAAYVISDAQGDKKYYDADGYLFRIEDSNGNVQQIVWHNRRIEEVIDAVGRSVLLEYDSDNRLITIIDPAGQEMRRQGNHGRKLQFTYNGNQLTSITYPHDLSDPSKKKTTMFFYDTDSHYDDMMCRIVACDGASAEMMYHDYRSDRIMTFTKRTKNNTVLDSLSFRYTKENESGRATGYTEVMNSKGDWKRFFFNGIGCATCITSGSCLKDQNGKLVKVNGEPIQIDEQAQFSEFHEAGSAVGKVVNQSGVLAITHNLLKNHNFEQADGNSIAAWTHTPETEETGDIFVAGQGICSANCLSLVRKAEEGYDAAYQEVIGENGKTYTLSAFIKIPQKLNMATEGGGVWVGFEHEGILYKSVIVEETACAEGWERYTHTFKLPSGATTFRVLLAMENASGMAFFDNVQLEEGGFAHEYNLVENSSFSSVATVQGQQGMHAACWDLYAADPDSGIYYVESESRYEARLAGSLTSEARISQEVLVGVEEGKTLIIGGVGAAYAKNYESNAFTGSIEIDDGPEPICTCTPCENHEEYDKDCEECVCDEACEVCNPKPASDEPGDTSSEGIGEKAKEHTFCIQADIYENAEDVDPVDTIYVDFDTKVPMHHQIMAKPIKLSINCHRIVFSFVYKEQINSAAFHSAFVYVSDWGDSYEYDKNGNLKEAESTLGVTTKTVYNDSGCIESVEQSIGDITLSSTTMVYDENSNLQSIMTEQGQSVEYEYDDHGQIVCQTTIVEKDGQVAHSTTEEISYIQSGNFMSTFMDSNGESTYVYDNGDYPLIGLVMQSKDPLDNVTYFEYDEYTDELISTTGDANPGLPSVQGVPDIPVATAFTMQDGLPKTIVRNGTNYTFIYDEQDRLLEVYIGSQRIVRFEYAGNLPESQIFENGAVYLPEYDEQSRLISEAWKDSAEDEAYTAATCSYDGYGQVSQTTDYLAGMVHHYYYRQDGKLSRVFSTDGAQLKTKTGYDFNANGDMTRLTFDQNSKRIYYTMSRYDLSGKPEAVAFPMIDSSVQYQYDALGRSAGHTLGQLRCTKLYDDSSERISQYKNENRIGDLHRFNYEYDAAGNIIKIVDPVTEIETEYVYDGLNRLIRETCVNPCGDMTTLECQCDTLDCHCGRTTTLEYLYDDGGNITSITRKIGDQPLEVLHTYAYSQGDWKDQLISFDDKEIAYDAVGNPTSYGERAFAWQRGHKLASVEDEGLQAEYDYDAKGKRIRKKVNGVDTEYIYVGDLLIRQSSENETLDFFYAANNLAAGFLYNGTPYFYLRNLQNDVVAITDAAGEIVAEYDYDAWGNATIHEERKVRQTVDAPDEWTALDPNRTFENLLIIAALRKNLDIPMEGVRALLPQILALEIVNKHNLLETYESFGYIASDAMRFLKGIAKDPFAHATGLVLTCQTLNRMSRVAPNCLEGFWANRGDNCKLPFLYHFFGIYQQLVDLFTNALSLEGKTYEVLDVCNQLIMELFLQLFFYHFGEEGNKYLKLFSCEFEPMRHEFLCKDVPDFTALNAILELIGIDNILDPENVRAFFASDERTETQADELLELLKAMPVAVRSIVQQSDEEIAEMEPVLSPLSLYLHKRLNEYRESLDANLGTDLGITAGSERSNLILETACAVYWCNFGLQLQAWIEKRNALEPSLIGHINPIRYRGYYFDTETGYYWLQTRYYSPEWRRFINADSLFLAGNDALNGSNMYAYCNDNPVAFADPSGRGVIGKIWSTINSIRGFRSATDMLKEIINDLPTGLWEVGKRVVQRLPDQGLEYAKRIVRVGFYNLAHFREFLCTTIQIVSDMINYVMTVQEDYRINRDAFSRTVGLVLQNITVIFDFAILKNFGSYYAKETFWDDIYDNVDLFTFVPAWLDYLVSMYDPQVPDRQFKARLFLGPVNYSWGEIPGAEILAFEETVDNNQNVVRHAVRRKYDQWQRYLGYNPAYDFVFRAGGEIMVKKLDFDCKPFNLPELIGDAVQDMKAWRQEQAQKLWDDLPGWLRDMVEPTVTWVKGNIVEPARDIWDRWTKKPREFILDAITPDPRHYRLWIWAGDYWNLGAGAEIGIYETFSDAEKEDQFYEVNPLNLLKSNIVLNYLKPDLNHPELSNPIIDYPNRDENGKPVVRGEGTNWWVCVFRPEAKFPTVVENMEVTFNTSFLGNAFDGQGWEILGSIFEWIETYFTQFMPNLITMSLSIPNLEQKLWEAFYDAMEKKEPNEKYRVDDHGIILGNRDTNEFTIRLNKGTDDLSKQKKPFDLVAWWNNLKRW